MKYVGIGFLALMLALARTVLSYSASATNPIHLPVNKGSVGDGWIPSSGSGTGVGSSAVASQGQGQAQVRTHYLGQGQRSHYQGKGQVFNFIQSPYPSHSQMQGQSHYQGQGQGQDHYGYEISRHTTHGSDVIVGSNQVAPPPSLSQTSESPNPNPNPNPNPSPNPNPNGAKSPQHLYENGPVTHSQGPTKYLDHHKHSQVLKPTHKVEYVQHHEKSYKTIAYEHHHHDKLIHNEHYHQHLIHQNNLRKVHVHNHHTQVEHLHQKHHHKLHVHQPIYHTHPKHVQQETVEHQHKKTQSETHKETAKVHEKHVIAPAQNFNQGWPAPGTSQGQIQGQSQSQGQGQGQVQIQAQDQTTGKVQGQIYIQAGGISHRGRALPVPAGLQGTQGVQGGIQLGSWAPLTHVLSPPTIVQASAKPQYLPFVPSQQIPNRRKLFMF